MIKCTQCGRLLPDNSTFCSGCGNQIQHNVDAEDGSIKSVSRNSSNDKNDGMIASISTGIKNQNTHQAPTGLKSLKVKKEEKPGEKPIIPAIEKEPDEGSEKKKYFKSKLVTSEARKFSYPYFSYRRCFFMNILAALFTCILDYLTITDRISLFKTGPLYLNEGKAVVVPGAFILVFSLVYALICRTKYGGLTEADGEAHAARGFFYWIQILTFLCILIYDLLFHNNNEVNIAVGLLLALYFIGLFIGAVLIRTVPSVDIRQKDSEERKRSPYITPEAADYHQAQIRKTGIVSILCSVSVVFSCVTLVLFYKCKAHYAFFAMSKKGIPNSVSSGMKLARIAFIISCCFIGALAFIYVLTFVYALSNVL